MKKKRFNRPISVMMCEKDYQESEQHSEEKTSAFLSMSGTQSLERLYRNHKDETENE